MSITFKIHPRTEEVLKLTIRQVLVETALDPAYLTGYWRLFPEESGELELIYKIEFRKTLDKSLLSLFSRKLNDHRIIEYAIID